MGLRDKNLASPYNFYTLPSCHVMRVTKTINKCTGLRGLCLGELNHFMFSGIIKLALLAQSKRNIDHYFVYLLVFCV